MMNRFDAMILPAVALCGCLTVLGDGPVEVRVRRTEAGPRLCVNGKAVRPRFYYGSPTCLCNIAGQRDVCFNYPFKATEDTENGRIDLEVYPGEGPMDWSGAELVNVTTATTNRFDGATRTKHYAKDCLKLKKDHVYRFRVVTRADHSRTYYTYKVGYTDAAGAYHPLPFPYGDTLGDATRFAADAGVDIVTFSTDSSWGCEKWWLEDLSEKGFARIDAMMDHLIAINPRVLLMPRVTGNAPDWFLERHPEAKMKFDRGFTIGMSSVSYRPYRAAVCAAVERLARHLYVKYPRNFAGLHISGQNSAEWFYMMSQSGDLSGYDVGTRDAFREYLRRQGAADWATAEVPSAEARRVKRDDLRFDPVKDTRTLDFIRFRNLEMATLLADIGAAVRRGTDGRKLSVFFYGYSWELGAMCAGAGESGHFAMKWLLDNAPDAADGFSAPMSYSSRNLLGSPIVMSAAETVTRKGHLWINEVDDRTHREEIWDHMSLFTPYSDPWATLQILKRNSVHCILRGYADWWMDLFGRGWHNEKEMWSVREELNALDDAMLKRAKPYSPEVAVVLDESSMCRNGWGSHRRMGGLVNRRGFAGSGTTCGQYLLEDFVENIPRVKLAYLIECSSLAPAMKARLESVKKAHPEITFVENPAAADLQSEAVSARAKKAGCLVYTAPGKAVVEAAEGYVMVQAREAGELELDFGVKGMVTDALSGKVVGEGPVLKVMFRAGEVRVFRTVANEVPRRVLELPPSAENCRNSEGDFALLKNGDVLLVYSHYVKGRGGDNDPAHLGTRVSKDGGRTWSATSGTAVENEGGMNVMSVSTLRLKDGSLALFYLRKNSKTDCRPVMRVSRDEGKSWGEPMMCVSDADIGYYVLNNCRAERLANGRILLPLCRHVSKKGGEFDYAGKLVCALSDDDGATWRLSGTPFATFDEKGKRVVTQEPGIVQLKDGRLLMYARTGHGRHWFYYSSDNGETWTKGEPGNLWGPCGPATLKRLKNGDLFAVWNDHEFAPELKKGDTGWGKRVPLTVAISQDEGRTWIHRHALEGNLKRGCYCYIAVLELEGRVLLEYCALDSLTHSRVIEVPLSWIYGTESTTTFTGSEAFFKD